jgi:hypothetical protein
VKAGGAVAAVLSLNHSSRWFTAPPLPPATGVDTIGSVQHNSDGDVYDDGDTDDAAQLTVEGAADCAASGTMGGAVEGAMMGVVHC